MHISLTHTHIYHGNPQKEGELVFFSFFFMMVVIFRLFILDTLVRVAEFLYAFFSLVMSFFRSVVMLGEVLFGEFLSSEFSSVLREVHSN